MNLSRRLTALLFGVSLLTRSPRLSAQAPPAALTAFDTTAAQIESRLIQASPNTLLTLDPATRTRLRSDQPLIEHLPTPSISGALLHHWHASAFVPGVTAAAFEHLLRDYAAYPHNFAPDVLSATVLTTTPRSTLLRLRTRQHHVLTVILDTTADVTFATSTTGTGYSLSRSTRIDQIAPAHPDQDLLFRLNTYWSWQQRDNGLYLQLESLSLTRSIPRGLAWAVQPFLDSVPRDSLVFTLTSATKALTTTTKP